MDNLTKLIDRFEAAYGGTVEAAKEQIQRQIEKCETENYILWGALFWVI